MQDRRTGAAAARKLDPEARKQLEEVQLLLAQRIQQALTIGDSLIELGKRLGADPWRWVIGSSAVAPPPDCVAMPLEFDIMAALDKERLKRLLDEIRWLKREEAKLIEQGVR